MFEDEYRRQMMAPLPQWQNIEDFDQQQQAPNVSPFVDALKKRMSSGMMKTGSDTAGTMGKAAMGGGGPSSL